MELRERVEGALLGFAVGDALGCTTEFLTAEDIAAAFGEVRDIVGGGAYDWELGEVTDDTDLMLAVADACLDSFGKSEGEILNDCCKNFAKWYSGNPKDIGNACRQVIRGGRFMKSWREWMKYSKAAQELSAPFLGNGGLMRCLVPAMMAVIEPKRYEFWKRVAIDQSSLTHNNNLCKYGVECFVNMMGAIEAACKMEKMPTIKHNGNSGHITDTLGCVVDYVRQAPLSSFEEIIIKAVNAGGDADTIAALTGGAVGFMFGAAAIPERWVEALQPEVRQRLLRAAERAIEMAQG